MVKKILFIGIVALMTSCKGDSNFKAAYVDSRKIVTEYEETKGIEEKYKAKFEETSKSLQGEIEQFQKRCSVVSKDVQAKGMQWAQKRGAELQQKEQELSMKQQSISQSIQQEAAIERDSAISKIKNHIKQFAEKNGYDYIFNTEDASTILYAKQGYDVTEEILKELNNSYKGSSTTTTTTTVEEVKPAADSTSAEAKK